MGSSLVLNRRPKVPAEDTAAFGAIAERFRRAGALEQAVSLCRDGLKKFPDHVSARVTLGWSLLDLGKYDEARVELEQVMRRAPDNLAAIRGLAELHDRFEHTLNLPMDGPGQWPPPADAEAVADDASLSQVAGATLESSDDARSEEVEAVAMAPAAMGLPLWTPEPAASPVAEAAPKPSDSTGSGMSSVREIDAFAVAPVQNVEAQVVDQVVDIEESVEAPVVAVAAQMGVTETAEAGFDLDVTPLAAGEESGLTSGVTSSMSDDAIAALIAEAESLDAAAELEGVAAPDALELGSVQVELDAAAPTDIDLARPEPFDEPIVVAIAEPIVEIAAEPIVEAVAEPIVEAVAEPVVEAVAEPVVEAVAEPIVESVAEPVFETIAEPTLEVVAEPIAAAIAEPVVDQVVESAFEPALESAIEIESVPELNAAPEVAAEVAEVLAFAPRPGAVTETVELDSVERSSDGQEDAVAQVIAMPSKSAARVVALERMLRRVQTRRRQLMAESVA